MGATSLAVSLGEGISSKTFAAEVTGRRGQPLRGVEVFVSLDGDVSLANDHEEHQFSGATDGLGRVAIVLNRPPESAGHVAGQVHVHCQEDEGSIQMRFVCMVAEARSRS
jgi:hypothetical protein